ncbi:NAD(P)-dependent oxidoreductase [Arthrobacter jiangjiafuii]
MWSWSAPGVSAPKSCGCCRHSPTTSLWSGRTTGRCPERTVTDDGLDEALAGADVVILAAAMTGGTEHLIDARRLALLRPEAFLVNISRGPMVDTEALVTALAGGKLAGAALDVTDPQPLPEGHPLWAEPRALITPHTAETPDMVAPLLAARVQENVRRFSAGQPLDGKVDVDEGY